MPESRGRVRKPQKQKTPIRRQTEKLPRLIHTILASWWGRFWTLAGVAVTALGLYEFYGTLSPDVDLSSLSSPPPVPFEIRNRNPFFEMYNVGLVCDVEYASFSSPKGPLVYSIPFTSGVSNAEPIGALKSGRFDCDAAQFAGGKSGEFCIGSLCTHGLGIDAKTVQLAKETLIVWTDFTIAGWRRSDESELFTWDGHTWSKGIPLK